jgi:hypothetical protein
VVDEEFELFTETVPAFPEELVAFNLYFAFSSLPFLEKLEKQINVNSTNRKGVFFNIFIDL